MEFLRFGSSIPGSYWGCCAVCIIQNFKFDPDEKMSIQVVDGDGGMPMGDQFLGMTYREIFNSRLRIGTFSDRDMPNHGFLAVLTESQINYNPGKKWLAILKEAGFEFIRTVDNSVYTGASVIGKAGEFGTKSPHKNYLFGLFRNIGKGSVEDPFTPPSAWTALPDPYSGDMSPTNMQAVQLDYWNNLGKAKFFTEDEIEKAAVPVVYAGKRSRYPQQKKGERKKVEEKDKNLAQPKSAKADPFAPVASAAYL